MASQDGRLDRLLDDEMVLGTEICEVDGGDGQASIEWLSVKLDLA